MVQVAARFAAYENALRREQWTRSLSEQISTWRQRATETLGCCSAVGATLGGAAATATGAALAVARGAVQGARDSSATDTSQGVPVSGNPGVADLLRPKRAARRARSVGSDPTPGHCLACHTAHRGHLRHLYTGDCLSIPGRSIFSSDATGADQSVQGRAVRPEGLPPALPQDADRAHDDPQQQTGA